MEEEEKIIDKSTNSAGQKYDQNPLADPSVEVTKDVADPSIERLDHSHLSAGLLTKTTEASEWSPPLGPVKEVAEDTMDPSSNQLDQSLSLGPVMEVTEQAVNPSCERLAQNLSTSPSIDVLEVSEDGVNQLSFDTPRPSISSGPAIEGNDVDPTCKKPDQSLPSGEVMEIIKDAVDPSFETSDQSLSLGPITEVDNMDPPCERHEKSLPSGEVMKVIKDAFIPSVGASYQSISLGLVSEVNDISPSCEKADKSLSSGQVVEVIEEDTIDSAFETCDQNLSPSSPTEEVPEPLEVSETESALDAGPTAAEAWESDVDSSEESSDDSAEESFVPDSEDSSSDESEIIPFIPMPTRKPAPVDQDVPGCSKTCNSDDFIEAKPAEKTVAKDSKVYVMTTNNTHTSRSYDKPAYCFVCSCPQKKLTVHITQHKDEPLVAQWLAAKENERDKLWTKIRNLGNHLHNYEVLEKGEGPLIVVYRPRGQAVPTDYQPCVDCLGYYSCNEFYRHKCKLRKPEKETEEKKRRTLIRQSRLLLPPPKGCKEGDNVHTLLGTLRLDDVSCCIKGDPLILDFAKKLIFKHGHDQEQFSCVRTKLRQVARLVLEFRLVSDIKDASLSDLFFPSRFCTVLTAVRSLAGFDDEMHTYTKPSLAIKIGQSLKKVAMMLVSKALIEGNTSKEREARDVNTLLTENWDVEVSSHALRTLYQGKRNNPKLLPLTADVVQLTKYLKEESVNSMNNLRAAETPDQVQNAWKKLANIIVTQLMLFNRKRQGEISKLTMEDYSNIKKGESHVLDVQTLTKFEQDLVKLMWRVEIVGKRGRTVPVLITDEMKKSLDELVKLRSDVGVNSNNQFVFAVLEGSDHHIRGCDALRTFSSTCGAKRPDLLRSTQLRKHVAVMSQIMALKENELDVLANFLGHDVRIHREYYRLPDPAIQVAKVSKLLVALEGDAGDPGKLLQGKSLDELELTQDEEIKEDQFYDSDNESEETEEDDDQPLSGCSEAGSKHSLDRDEVSESPKCKKSTHGKKSKVKQAAPSKVKPKKVPWTDEERAAVMRHLGNYIIMQKLPGKEAIQAVIIKENCLKNRTWKNIKDFVRNRITSKARKSERNYMY